MRTIRDKGLPFFDWTKTELRQVTNDNSVINMRKKGSPVPVGSQLESGRLSGWLTPDDHFRDRERSVPNQLDSNFATAQASRL
ncbi:hypothetical protein Poly41_37900 [Novipirellula artificiosorum]|uniref:Uncharacterized protein n=1 Tax=Novipirellula artificiosorum TaxID=2528016 RepID=A0A5C6DJF4_9BACT|nr:hypothetical protein Poly41_37900 [Novipirellula artificiosorum]